MPDSRDKRRWFQFGLRAIFVLVLLVAAFFGGRESMRGALENTKADADDCWYQLKKAIRLQGIESSIARDALIRAKKAEAEVERLRNSTK